MNATSALSCEHIYIRRIPGRTDAFIAALQNYLRKLLTISEGTESAEIIITPDGSEHRFEWYGEAGETNLDSALSAMETAAETDVRINICSDLYSAEEEQRSLNALLRDGSLKDCVRCSILLEDEHTSSLTMSGLYRGAFLHGAVPFVSDASDILLKTAWNGYTHRAEFRFAPAAFDDAQDLGDLLEDRLEIELVTEDNLLRVENVHLEDADEVAFYREMLEKLTTLAESAQITGALTPESDEIFALLRFVRENSAVTVQTAVAEG